MTDPAHSQIKHPSQALASRAQELRQSLEECQQERNSAWAELLELQLESETQMTELRARISHMEMESDAARQAHAALVDELQREKAARTDQIGVLERCISERDARIEELNRSLDELNRAMSEELNQAMSEVDRQRQAAERAKLESDARIAALNHELVDRENRLEALYRSFSWRITAPIRALKRSWPAARRILGTWVRSVYLALPLPMALKMTLKGLIFAALSPLLEDTQAYQAWLQHQRSRSTLKPGRRGIGAAAGEWIDALYCFVPLPKAVKVWLKGLLFALFSPLLRNTASYQAWLEFERNKRKPGARPQGPDSISALEEWLRALYRVMPLPMGIKVRLKGLCFALFSPLLSRLSSYRAWAEFEQARSHGGTSPPPPTEEANPASPSDVDSGPGTVEDHSPSSKADSSTFLLDMTEAPGVEQQSPLDAISRTMTADVQPADAAPERIELAPMRSFDELLAYVAERYGSAAAVTVAHIIARHGLSHDDTQRDQTLSTNEGVATLAGELQALAGARLTQHEPEITVVIPVFNQRAHTLACIHSILAWATEHSFELVIADDCSDDPLLTALLSRVPQVRVIRPEANLGFLRNCNHAAKSARGRLLVFLNNDTLVLPGWLDALADTFERFPKAGLAGSKLLFGDGRLQEAGGIVWADGSGWNFGRGEDPRRPEFNYLKEADYCSGASIMIPSRLFRELEGFDERFAPAYCEDTDLAFRIRENGYRVYYQPRSEVVHFEGISSGTDLDSGVKRYQLVNQQKLAMRWEPVFKQSQFISGQHLFLARDRGSGHPHILVIDHYVPQFDRDAGSRTMYQYVTLLAKRDLRVTFWPENLHYDRPYVEALQDSGIEVVYGNAHHNGFDHWCAQYGRYFDYVLLSRPHIAKMFLPAVRQHSPAKVLYYGHDIHHLRLELELGLYPTADRLEEAREARALELYTWQNVDVVYYPSEEECKVVSHHYPGRTVRALPAFCFDGTPPTAKPPKRGQTHLLFVGGFGHRPNVDAVHWFLTEVWPRLLDALPDLVFNIAGSNPPPHFASFRSANVRILGYVDEKALEDLYREARVAVAPLRAGAGVKGKVVESLWRGIPVVTTPIGAQGLPGTEEFLPTCRSAEEFADAVMALCRDTARWRSVSKAGQRYVRRHFSTDALLSSMSQDIPELRARENVRANIPRGESAISRATN